MLPSLSAPRVAAHPAGEGARRRPGMAAWAARLAAALLAVMVLLLAGVAASSGPMVGFRTETITKARVDQTSTGPAEAVPPPGSGPEVGGWLAALAALSVVLAVTIGVSRWRRRPQPARPSPPKIRPGSAVAEVGAPHSAPRDDDGNGGHPGAEPPPLAGPRAAVIGCWLALAELATGTKPAASPPRTTGHLLRCLPRHLADHADVRFLRAAYLRARFSPEPVEDSLPSAAWAALARVRAAWEQPVGDQAGRPRGAGR